MCLHPNTCQDYACVSDVADDYIDEDEDKEFAFRGGGLAPVVEHVGIDRKKNLKKTFIALQNNSYFRAITLKMLLNMSKLLRNHQIKIMVMKMKTTTMMTTKIIMMMTKITMRRLKMALESITTFPTQASITSMSLKYHQSQVLFQATGI